MKLLSRLLLIFIALFIILFLSLYFYTRWGRRIVYTHVDQEIGEKYGEVGNLYVLVNKNDPNEQVFIKPEELDNYDKAIYDFTYIPAHTTLKHVVGTFVRWEDVNNSSDKYLVLGFADKSIKKYRFVVTGVKLRNIRPTSIMVENSVYIYRNKPEQVSIYILPVSDYGIDKLKKLFSKGDVITITPSYEENGKEMVDNNNSVLVGSVKLKRSFGEPEIKFELMFIR